jgi:putative transposase
VRYRFIKEHEGRFPVSSLCRALQVSRSGYSVWRNRPESHRTRQEQELLACIRATHQESRGTYGSPRIHQELRDDNVACGRNRVARIMRKYQITARPLRRFVRTTDSSHSLPGASNLLQQKFTVEDPNTRWSADITYLWTGEGWLYLAVVLDLYSRRVVGWSLKDTLDRSLVLNALQDGLMQRKPGAGLICHSDRGSQYASGDYQELLTKAGAVCSMNPKDVG